MMKMILHSQEYSQNGRAQDDPSGSSEKRQSHIRRMPSSICGAEAPWNIQKRNTDSYITPDGGSCDRIRVYSDQEMIAAAHIA